MQTTTNPAVAVLSTEARLFGREPAAMFWILIFPVGLLTILGVIPMFRETDPNLGGLRLIDLYVPVTVLLAMIVAGIQTMPGVLASYRERGILRRLEASPAKPTYLLMAQIVVHAVAVAVSVVLALLVGRVVFDVALPAQPFGYALAVVLTLAAALSMGAAIAAVSSSMRVAQTVGTIVFFPMMFCAGVWLPVQTMPDLLRRVVEVTPFGAASQILDQAASGSWPSMTGVAVVAGWAIVLTAAAVKWFRWQ
ncbi:ABC transporter permease [Rhodococcus sp. SMB37]|uniref:ABC transporter permease n=1 Tax=Rhodococcus sp. SMB37 TaxID=2512213 RepID=UPI001048A4F6|nr:ABC transporter permease [Rhodococcus sp. SMB37]